MALYWFFDFPGVAAHNPVLPAVADSITFQDAIRSALVARRGLAMRQVRAIPL